MTKRNIILFGAGGHSASCIDVIEHENKYTIAGLVGLKSEVGSIRNGYEIIGSDEDISALARQYEFALVAVGQVGDYCLRTTLYDNVCRSGFTLPTIVSPKAIVSKHVNIGQGTIVMHGSIINAQATIGRNCIINTGAIVEHGSIIGNSTHISTGVVVNGGVRIGDETFIGSGSVLRQGVSIHNRAFVKMGSQIVSDVV
jgi:sugar O-acyltransferase (sialic acid O-acetyltransferase NeuD family)